MHLPQGLSCSIRFTLQGAGGDLCFLLDIQQRPKRWRPFCTSVAGQTREAVLPFLCGTVLGEPSPQQLLFIFVTVIVTGRKEDSGETAGGSPVETSGVSRGHDKDAQQG